MYKLFPTNKGTATGIAKRKHQWGVCHMQDLFQRLSVWIDISPLRDALTSITRYFLVCSIHSYYLADHVNIPCQSEPVVIFVILKYAAACAL